MATYLFGPVAIFGWCIASSILAFCAAYTWSIVREVGGIRGTIYATIFSCLSVICGCFAMIIADQDWISGYILGALVTACFPPILFGSLILTDLYSADRNSHRAYTTRSYLWYKRVTRDKQEERDVRHVDSL